MNAERHLTEDELDDLLLGRGTAEAEQHVTACGSCREQVLQFQSALGAFNQATLAWAEARSATLPQQHQPVRRAGWRLPAAWAAGALTAAVALGVATHSVHPRPVAPPAVAVAIPAVDRTGEIAKDNELLAAIDSALFTQEASPSELFQQNSAAELRARRPARRAKEQP